jgi:hypothetical protein
MDRRIARIASDMDRRKARIASDMDRRKARIASDMDRRIAPRPRLAEGPDDLGGQHGRVIAA